MLLLFNFCSSYVFRLVLHVLFDLITLFPSIFVSVCVRVVSKTQLLSIKKRWVIKHSSFFHLPQATNTFVWVWFSFHFFCHSSYFSQFQFNFFGTPACEPRFFSVHNIFSIFTRISAISTRIFHCQDTTLEQSFDDELLEKFRPLYSAYISIYL